MASTISSGLSLPPPHLLLFELLCASVAVGCTPADSWLRPAALPVLSACSYSIIRHGVLYMRPRWASLVGGFSVAILYRYLDIGLINRWNFENKGPASPSATSNTSASSDVATSTSSNSTFLDRLKYGWYTLWSFRQVNTPYEVKNVPRFSRSDPEYVPSRVKFVLQQFSAAAACYVLLDLLGQRAPPSNPAALFNPALIPIFGRLNEVTAAEIKLRALTIAGFGVNFFFIIQGFQSLAASLAVGAGLSPIENWRPAFGSIGDAYTLKNVWGKFWHQLLRRPLSVPATFLVHNVLGLPRRSKLAGILTVSLTFALSGLLHTAAGVSSGMPLDQLGVIRFFCTQAAGLILEQSVISLFKRTEEEGDQSDGAPAWYAKLAGFIWVGAFMAWTGPSWIYPQAARASAPAQGPSAFLPFSIVGWLKEYRAAH